MGTKMSDELQNNSDLELVDKVAVAAVFLLAGVFLWQFVGTGDEHLRSASGDEWAVNSDDDLDRTPYTVETLNAEPQVLEAEVRPAKVELPVLSKKVADVSVAPIETVAKIAPLIPAAVAIPAIKPVQIIEKVVEPIVEIATPTIRPVTSDLSKGVVRLSGTGEPGSHLQLMLNGQKTTQIEINRRGEWAYATNLEAGDYSIQVIPPELNEQLSSKSAVATISIPKPPEPVVIEEPEIISVPEVIKAPVVVQVKEKEVVIPPVIAPIIQKVKAQVKPKPAPVVRKKIIANKNLYKVKYGDTLNKLSRRFNISLSSILKANNISDKDVIEVGEMIVIPGHFSGKERSISDAELRKGTYSPEKDEWGF